MEAKPLSTKGEITLIKQQLAQVDKNFVAIGKFFETLKPLQELATQIAARQSQPAAAAPAGGGQDILVEILKGVMQSGGGSSDSEMAALGKQALMSQIELSKAITSAVTAKITGKAVAEVADAVAQP